MKKLEEKNLTEKEKRTIYREQNKEKLRIVQREYYKKNKDKILSNRKKRATLKSEEQKARDTLSRKQSYLKNKDKQARKQKERRAIDKAKKQKLEFFEELMRMNKFVPTPVVKESRLKKFFNRIFKRK